MRSRPITTGLVVALTAGVCITSTASAQSPGLLPAAQNPTQTSDNASRLTRRITVSLQQKRLEDVFAFVKAATGAKLEPLWTTDRKTEGLDRDAIISLEADNLTALELIEQVLEQLPQNGSAPTWQPGKSDTLQIGPRSRLNKYKRLHIYDVKDILKEAPDHTRVRTIDLQQALQPGGGSPFRGIDIDDGTDPAEKKYEKARSVEDLATLIREIVEPEQWIENGGDGASIKLFQGSLIITAPDYIHRQVATLARSKRSTKD